MITYNLNQPTTNKQLIEIENKIEQELENYIEDCTT